MQVATVGGVLCPSGPNPPSAFCEASGKRIRTSVLTSLRCLGPEGRGPQTQKESGLQHPGVRGSRETHKVRGSLGVRAVTQAEGTAQLCGWSCTKDTAAHAETARASGPGSGPSIRLGQGS